MAAMDVRLLEALRMIRTGDFVYGVRLAAHLVVIHEANCY